MDARILLQNAHLRSHKKHHNRTRSRMGTLLQTAGQGQLDAKAMNAAIQLWADA